VIFGLDSLEFWGRTAELDGFASAFECSFAINLLYSLLLNFGSFSGQRIDSWADDERLRIKAALTETPTFDAARFETKVNSLKALWGGLIKYSNIVVIVWGVLAAISSILLLIIGVGFYGEVLVSAPIAMRVAAVLFGAIPPGLLVCAIWHLCARFNMRGLSREWNNAIEYIKKAPAETIAEAREDLRKKPRDPTRSRKR
jgi:hypothetical protein